MLNKTVDKLQKTFLGLCFEHHLNYSIFEIAPTLFTVNLSGTSFYDKFDKLMEDLNQEYPHIEVFKISDDVCNLQIDCSTIMDFLTLQPNYGKKYKFY